jgi:hypothetical protein
MNIELKGAAGGDGEIRGEMMGGSVMTQRMKCKREG